MFILLHVIQWIGLTFDLSVLPFPYSPVNLVSPTRFRFVYAFIFGAISSTLLGLVFSSRGITLIKVQTHYLDIFVNTSEFSVEWRRLPCFQRLHQSLTSLSFPSSPLLHLPLPFLLPSFLLPFPPPFLLLSSSLISPNLQLWIQPLWYCSTCFSTSPSLPVWTLPSLWSDTSLVSCTHAFCEL